MDSENTILAGQKMRNFISDLISDAIAAGSELTGAKELIDNWDSATGADWKSNSKAKGTSELFS